MEAAHALHGTCIHAPLRRLRPGNENGGSAISVSRLTI